MSSANASSDSRTRSRLSMALLFLLFAAPVVLAWLLFYVFPEWQPSGTTNHGRLIEPVRQVPAVELSAVDGSRIDETFFRGKWTLLYVTEGSCDEFCVEQLYKIRQVRLAQGKNIDRLRRLLLWDDRAVSDEQRLALQKKFPGQVIASVAAGEPAALVDVFALDGADPFAAAQIYLIDPLGNLMMTYEAADEPRGIIKDLEKLLKWSGLG